MYIIMYIIIMSIYSTLDAAKPMTQEQREIQRRQNRIYAQRYYSKIAQKNKLAKTLPDVPLTPRLTALLLKYEARIEKIVEQKKTINNNGLPPNELHRVRAKYNAQIYQARRQIRLIKKGLAYPEPIELTKKGLVVPQPTTDSYSILKDTTLITLAVSYFTNISCTNFQR